MNAEVVAMRAVRRQAKAALALTALLVAGACGSTVDEAGRQSRRAGGGGADEFAVPSESAGSASDSTTPSGGDVGAGRPGTAAGRAPGGNPSTRHGGAVGGRVPVGQGVRGVDDATILIGMVDIDLSAAAGAVNAIAGSAPGYQDSTTRPIGERVTAYVNDHGGVAGRKLKIVWHRSNAADLATAEGRRRDAQRACSTWTEDNQVFAMIGRLLVSEVYFDCARRRNVVLMPYHNGPAVDERLSGELHPLWYSLSRMVAERRDRNLVDSLVRRGALPRDAKVGIMVEDWAGSRRGVSNGMEPALAAHGIEVVAKAVYPDAIQSPWDTYVLQFRTAGVTHVLAAQPWARSAFDLLFMMRAAENQGWRPVWGVGSDNQPFGVARSGAPRPQLARTHVMGWQPEADLGRYDETKAAARCADLAGEPVANTGDDWWLTFCDVLFFFQAALNHAPEVSPAGVHAAMAGLGDTYESISALGGRTRFAPDRHDGVAVQRDLVYDTRCADDGSNCWQYVGGPRPMR